MYMNIAAINRTMQIFYIPESRWEKFQIKEWKEYDLNCINRMDKIILLYVSVYINVVTARKKYKLQ